MRCLLLIMCTVTACTVFSQDYLNFSTVNVTAYSLDPYLGFTQEGTLTHTVSRDTMIVGNQYFEFWQKDVGHSYPNNQPGDITYYSNERAIGFYRMANGKFYRYDKLLNLDHLIYDYNLSLGDTAHFLNCYYPPVVTKIDTVPIGDHFRKRFHFSGYAQPQLIEGAGTSLDFLYYHCYPTWEQGYSLRCHVHNNEVLFNPSHSRCDEFVGFESNGLDELNVVIAPNPFTESIRIELPKMESCLVRLYALSGQLIREKTIQQSSTTMEFDDLQAGSYFIQIQSPEWFATRQIIKVE